MKENAPLDVATRDAEQKELRAPASVPFRIIGLQSVAHGSKTAEFSVETALGVIECDLFVPQGREPFVQTRSVRDKFSGQWRRTVALDRTFAARVLDALRAQASTAKEKRAPREPRSVQPSETILASESRFDAAFAAFDDGDGAP